MFKLVSAEFFFGVKGLLTGPTMKEGRMDLEVSVEGLVTAIHFAAYVTLVEVILLLVDFVFFNGILDERTTDNNSYKVMEEMLILLYTVPQACARMILMNF